MSEVGGQGGAVGEEFNRLQIKLPSAAEEVHDRQGRLVRETLVPEH